MATVQINGNLKKNDREAIFVYEIDEAGHGVRTYDAQLHTAYMLDCPPPEKYKNIGWIIYYENPVGFRAHSANALRDKLYNSGKRKSVYEYLVSIDGFETYWGLKSHSDIKQFLHLDRFEIKTITGMHLTVENRVVIDSKTFKPKSDRRFVHY